MSTSALKYLDEYRDADAVRALAQRIAKAVSRPWVIMEICGGQTHGIVRYGLDQLLPESVELVHGPGCPVCVTPLAQIDRALAIAAEPDVIFCSYGDMLRVPGSNGDLLGLRARGADVRVVYSPLDAVRLAEREPSKQVVFFAIGFETTAPANAMAVHQAEVRRLKNFSVLVSHVLVPPALDAILEAPDNRVQAFLGPGHVCTVMGSQEYEAISCRYRVPIVISGFEPVDLLHGVLTAVEQLERGQGSVANNYGRSVRAAGNPQARGMVERVFEVCDREWRGVGSISKSGYRLGAAYRDFDAERRFNAAEIATHEDARCISGQILTGAKKPPDCPAFGQACTKETPLGATMVSSEGACAVYFSYRQHGWVPESRLSRNDARAASLEPRTEIGQRGREAK